MKLIKIEENGLTFDNGTTIEYFHESDCCENVYADWKQLEDTDVLNHEFNEKLVIEGVKESGFRIEGYFVPCYNQQNGYYSSNLSLIIKKDKEKKEIDISEFVKDEID